MKLCKIIQSRKGFTLVEIMVALSLLIVVVFGFTPVMLHALTQVKDSGKGETAIYAQQGEMEKQLAGREAIEAPPTIVPVIFEKVLGTGPSGEVSSAIPISGKALTGDGGMKLTTFFVDKDPIMTVDPSSICDDMNIETDQLKIFGTNLVFKDVNVFKLYSLKSGQSKEIKSVTFSLTDNESIATLKLSNDVTMAGGPYEIRYGNAKAQFRITPPALLIVGNKGTYIVSDGKPEENGTLTFRQKTGFPTQNLKAVAWNHIKDRYEVGGDKYDGKEQTNDHPLYSNSANYTWNHIEKNEVITRVLPRPMDLNHSLFDNILTIANIHFIDSDVEIFTVGVLHDGEAMWGGFSRTNWGWDVQNWGKTVHRTDGENFCFYQKPYGDDPPVKKMHGKEIKKILTGFDSNGDVAVDVVFGTPDANYHYDVVGGNSYQINNSDLVVKSAAYGLTKVNNQPKPLFKVVSNKGIFSSTQGINNNTWAADGPNNTISRYTLNDIAFGGDRWVAIGNGNSALYSTDGTNWTASNTIPSPAVVGSVYNSIAYTNGYFVAVGNNGLISYSDDGQKWKSTKVGTENLNGVSGQ